MSNKYTKQIPGLLDSQIHNDFISVPPLIIKSTKSLNPSLQNQKINSPLHKKSLECKSQQQVATSDQSFFSKSLPNSLKIQRQIQTSVSSESCQQIRIQQQRKILQRNFGHQLQYYIRLRMKDLSTVLEMLTANQYQRLFKYAETQLIMWKKIHEDFLREDNIFKGTVSRDTYIKSNILSIDEDLTYKQTINNIITSLQQNEKNVTILPSTIQKLNAQNDLTVKKLANYLQQTPFLVKSSQASTNLATRFIKELRYSDGHQVLQLLSKSVKQISKGRYMIPIEQPLPKSQMSKLIEQHSISKIKNKKSLS